MFTSHKRTISVLFPATVVAAVLGGVQADHARADTHWSSTRSSAGATCLQDTHWSIPLDRCVLDGSA